MNLLAKSMCGDCGNEFLDEITLESDAWGECFEITEKSECPICGEYATPFHILDNRPKTG